MCLAADHEIIFWIAEHTAVLLNKYEVGLDAKTGSARTRAKP